MSPSIKVGLIVLTVAVLLWLGWVLWSSQLKFECEATVLTRQVAPANQNAAVVLERSCGATTSKQKIVAVVNTNKTFNSEDSEGWVFVAESESDVQISWRDSKTLVVKSSTGTVRRAEINQVQVLWVQ
jgi:hypothetical protein